MALKILLPLIVLWSWKILANDSIYAHLFQQDNIEEQRQEEERQKKMEHLQMLLYVKTLLVNGQVDKSQVLLQKMSDYIGDLKYIKQRYLALIYFIKDDYPKAWSILNTPYFNHSAIGRQETCVLRIVTQIALRHLDSLESQLQECYSHLLPYATNDHLWPEILVRLALENKNYLNGNFLLTYDAPMTSAADVRIWAKALLYLNKEQLINTTIDKLDEEAFQSHRTRELLGLLYYRAGNMDLAAKLIEGVDTANAENIRGNLKLSNKEYELAYGHFKLAQKYKKNSINAIARSIPLAWTLGQWEEGIELLNRYSGNNINEINKLALKAAFYLRLEKYDIASEILELVNSLLKSSLPKTISLMHAYLALELKQDFEFQKHTDLACKKMDGISCWLQQQSIIWDNPTTLLSSEGQILATQMTEIEEMSNTTINQPLEEALEITQEELEELDFGTILIKRPEGMSDEEYQLLQSTQSDI